MLSLATYIAIFLYLIATILQSFTLKGQAKASPVMIKLIAGSGVILHMLTVYRVLNQPDGINLGFFITGSLVAWLVAAVVVISSLRQPIENIFIGVLPMASLTAALAAWGPSLGVAQILHGGLIIHILLSILAYSILTVATFEAFLLSKQDLALKQHNTRGLVASLPPLQTMERLLFEMLWIGMLLLTSSLLTGFIFLDDIFAQQLVHKAILSIIAWFLYAILLWGRIFRGWRGHQAVRWTISGFFLLMLSFFGSKLVIELIDVWNAAKS